MTNEPTTQTQVDLDVDALNEAAKLVYDGSRAIGYRAGYAEANAKRADEAARGLYDIAQHVLRFALDLAEESPRSSNRAAMLAKLTLGRTPHHSATEVLGILSRGRWTTPTPVDVDVDVLRDALVALEHITAALPYHR